VRENIQGQKNKSRLRKIYQEEEKESEHSLVKSKPRTVKDLIEEDSDEEPSLASRSVARERKVKQVKE
jgi:hypothetical protein